MLCKIDENMPVEAATILTAAGHDCLTIYDEDLSGASDDLIATACRSEGRVLLTLDLDFSDVRLYPPGTHPGIIVLRPREPDRSHALRLLSRALRLFDVEMVEARLWIVDDGGVRIRG